MRNILLRKELKREKIMSEIDNFYKLKTLDIPNLIKYIEKEIYSHKYYSNKDYLLIGRKKDLMDELDLILNKEDRFANIKSHDEKIFELIRVLVQFIGEGCKAYPHDVCKINNININYNEMKKKCDKYTLTGIICLEEKENILNMLEKIKDITE